MVKRVLEKIEKIVHSVPARFPPPGWTQSLGSFMRMAFPFLLPRQLQVPFSARLHRLLLTAGLMLPDKQNLPGKEVDHAGK